MPQFTGVLRLQPGFRRCGVSGCSVRFDNNSSYLETLPPEHVFVKLDLGNAFNSLHRSGMSVADRIPDLYYVFCYSAYYHSSLMFHGPYLVFSQEGPRPGDQLGPLLFCNTIHPLVQSLEANLSLGFLDDLALGGSENVVADDISKIIKEGEELGLIMNTSKCELITHRWFNVQSGTLRSFQRVEVEETVLGAPLFVGPAFDSAWSQRCDDLRRAVNRMSNISSQEALILLWASFSEKILSSAGT